MTETKKVIVDGVELEVEVEIADDGKWLASVEGKTFQIELPDSGPVVKKKAFGWRQEKEIRNCICQHTRENRNHRS